MLKKKLILLMVVMLVAAFHCTANAQAGKQQKSIVVGVVTTAPPFSYVKNGNYTGISNDILQQVAKSEGLKLNYQPMKFDALIPALQAGQIDIAVSGIFVTEVRKKVVDFSTPYYEQGSLLVAPVDSSINSVADLKGKVIAAEQGAAALAVAKRHAQQWEIKIRILQDAANMQLAMKTGDVDAMIYDSGIMAYQIKSEKDHPSIKAISEVIDPTGIAFAFAKGSQWVEIVNTGMDKLFKNNEITNIRNDYNLD